MILFSWMGLPSILIMLKQWSALPSIFQACPFIHLFALPYLPLYKKPLQFWMDALALPWKACLLILQEAMARETFGLYSCWCRGCKKDYLMPKKGSPSFKGLSELCTPHFRLWWTRTTGLGKHKQNFWLSSLERLHVRHKVIYSHCCHQTFSDRMGVPLSFESTMGLNLCKTL